jgi:hypothetical protein
LRFRAKIDECVIKRGGSAVHFAQRVAAFRGRLAAHRCLVDLIRFGMRYIPPCSVLEKWLAGVTAADSARLSPTYDDVLDVLKGFLQAIPVDEDWYKAKYPGILAFLARSPEHTATSHFQKHGYFERREPFAPGWRGLTAPVPFAQLRTVLRLSPTRGHLRADIARDDFIALIKAILLAVPIDEAWYRATYPRAEKAIADGTFPSLVHHYAEQGYFDGYLPFDMEVDDEWYASRYDHVRIGLQRGVARSAREHFLRIGYSEGCRPAPP